MTIAQRLTTLERTLGANSTPPEPLLVRIIGAKPDSNDLGGILYIYKPHLNTEYRLTPEQVELYDNDQLDLSGLTPHKVIEY
jgi:hypothetical protein